MTNKQYKLFSLKQWLLSNNFRAEASYLTKLAISDEPMPLLGDDTGGDDTGGESDWTTMDTAHLTLDVVGLVPGWGEPADITNALLYAIEEDYFSAALCLLAMLPALGIGFTVIRRVIKNRAAKEAIGFVGDAIRASNVSPQTVRQFAVHRLDDLIVAADKLKRSIPDEIARNIPETGKIRVGVMNQIEQIMANIRISSATRASRTLQRSSRSLTPRQIADLNNIKDYWRALTPAQAGQLVQIGVNSAKVALVRLSGEFGAMARLRVQSLFPHLSEEMQEKILKNYSDDIVNMKIIIVDNVDDLTSLGFEDSLFKMGGSPLVKNEIRINLPGLAARNGTDKLPASLYETLGHEINHNTNTLLGRAYYRAKNPGVNPDSMLANFDQDTGRRLQTESDRWSKGFHGDLAPDEVADLTPYRSAQHGEDLAVTQVRGSPLADHINRYLTEVNPSASRYLRDPDEIAVRFRNLKNFINNEFQSFGRLAVDFPSSLTHAQMLALTQNPSRSGSRIPVAILLDIKTNRAFREAMRNSPYGDDVVTLADSLPANFASIWDNYLEPIYKLANKNLSHAIIKKSYN
tara:strand:+ start:255 stop:1982 length:1728 start_codon:yes stop_codon:yes gene_type:complete